MVPRSFRFQGRGVSPAGCDWSKGAWCVATPLFSWPRSGSARGIGPRTVEEDRPLDAPEPPMIASTLLVPIALAQAILNWAQLVRRV